MDVRVNENMITTAFELPGYRVARSMGLVRGITVRSRSILGTIGASLETLVGGNITLFEGNVRDDARASAGADDATCGGARSECGDRGALRLE